MHGMKRIYGYLRASTKEQDASRARQALEDFAKNAFQTVSGWFVENESGATLKRPELFRLLEIAQQGDILLVEQVDRISRLNTQDWEQLKSQIKSKGITIVSLDITTSHQFISTKSDDFTYRMLAAINSMMLDMLAAVARKDYEDRRRRQSQGIAKAKREGKYRGRPINQTLRRNIKALINDGCSISEIVDTIRCSNKTVISVRKELAAFPKKNVKP
jgi:DNA invertase Pin-like site-specific DNA recombinase